MTEIGLVFDTFKEHMNSSAVSDPTDAGVMKRESISALCLKAWWPRKWLRTASSCFITITAKGEVDYLIDDYDSLSAVPSDKDYTVHSALNTFVKNDDSHVKKGFRPVQYP